MDRYDAKKVTPVEASPKLDGVYGRATREGVFTKSGQKLQAPHIEARLRRYFKKHPAGQLEGELWRKKAGIEAISGEARSGKTEKLRLHVYPGQESPPLPFGAVRRVPGWKVKDDAGVRAALARALRKGHEGVVVRGADGGKSKLKPQMDAEYRVEGTSNVQRRTSNVEGKRKTVLVMKTAEGRPFKVQAGGGAAAARAGDQVQVRYSGLTRRGVPKAAVAVRVRNENDFAMKNLNRQDAKDAKLKRFAEVLTPRQDEQVRKDRKALLKGAILTAAGVGAGYLLLRGGKKVAAAGGVPSGPAPTPKWKVEHPGLPAPRPEVPPLRERVTRWGGRNEKETWTQPVIALRGKATPKVKGPGLKVAARANNERKGGVKRLVKAAELKRERAWGALKPPSAKRLAKLSPATRAEYARLDAAARGKVQPLPGPAAYRQVTAREAFGKAEQGARKVNRQILQAYREQKNFTRKMKQAMKNLNRQDAKDAKLKEFEKDKRDGFSKARDAALLAGGLGILGASGYGALRAHGLYKVAKKAIPRQAVKLRKTAEGALKAAREELPAIRKATDVTQQKIQETAARVQASADNVVNSTAIYSDAGKLYKSAKAGLGNLLHPRRTLREVKNAFRSGYQSGRYGAPDSFVPEKRAKWELSTPAGRLLRFEDKPLTQEEMERLYGRKAESGKRKAEMKKKRGWLFATPASRLIDFGNEEQWREKDTRRYGNPLKAAAGLEKGYFRMKPGTKEPMIEDIPLAHAQVLKSTYNKAHKIQKHATRVGLLGKDVVNVATGKPRERDAAGREKKREWEKPWFKTAARNVAITGAMLYGAKRLKDHPNERAWVKRQVNKGVRKVNEYVPDFVKEWSAAGEEKHFSTPMERILKPLRKGALGKFMGPDKALKQAAADRTALVGRLKAAQAAGSIKASDLLPRAKRHAAMKQAKVAAAERAQKKAVRGLKKGAGIAAGGALVGGTVMKLHADQPEKSKVNQGARFRNALLGAAAGSYLGAALHTGRSGFRGARIGALAGGLVGAVSNPKRKQIIEDLPTASFEEGRKLNRQDAKDAKVKMFAGKVPFRGITVKRYPGQKVRPGAARGTWARYVADTWGVPAKHSAEAVEAARKIRIFKKNPVGQEIEGARKALLKDPEIGRWVKNKSTPSLVVAGKYGKEFYKKGSRETKDQINRLNIARAQGKSVKVGKGMIGAPYVETDFGRKLNRQDAKGAKVRNFDDIAADAGWDIRDPRGKSARVFAPGSRRRVRREKEWYEKKDNRDKMALALAAATGLAGLAGGVKLGRRMKPKPHVTPAADSNVFHGPWVKRA